LFSCPVVLGVGNVFRFLIAVFPIPIIQYRYRAVGGCSGWRRRAFCIFFPPRLVHEGPTSTTTMAPWSDHDGALKSISNYNNGDHRDKHRWTSERTTYIEVYICHYNNMTKIEIREIDMHGARDTYRYVYCRQYNMILWIGFKFWSNYSIFHTYSRHRYIYFINNRL